MNSTVSEETSALPLAGRMSATEILSEFFEGAAGEAKVERIQEMIARREQVVGATVDSLYPRMGGSGASERGPSAISGVAKERGESTGAAGAGNEMKPLIMIVDDQAGIRNVLSVVLGGAYRIVEAGNGIEAIALMDEAWPQLVITDVIMPRMNGVELVEWVRQNPRIEKIPVIAMSGYHDENARARLNELGVAAFLSKPFSLMEIPGIVQRVLAEAKVA